MGASLVRFVYHRPGKGTSVFEERLLVDRADLKVLEMPRYAGPPVVVRGQVVLEPGARALWFVIPGAWYELGRFHLADGSPTGWYTNFCTPVVVDRLEWTSTDLFLDHWLSREGWGAWLDERELAQAEAAGLLTPELLGRLEAERSSLARRLEARAWPPPDILDEWGDARPDLRQGPNPKPGGV